jgi:hypothetical protein
MILFYNLVGLIANACGVGSHFIELWLLPLGYIITSSRRMPVWLGRVLIIGGIGYLLSVLVNYIGIESPIIDYLAIPATIGEF